MYCCELLDTTALLGIGCHLGRILYTAQEVALFLSLSLSVAQLKAEVVIGAYGSH